jgi:hypothetical protein
LQSDVIFATGIADAHTDAAGVVYAERGFHLLLPEGLELAVWLGSRTNDIQSQNSTVAGSARPFFSITGLIYLRARVGVAWLGVGFLLSSVSLSHHALEQLVERSVVPLRTALLPQVDTEAQAIFRGRDSMARIIDADDQCCPAAMPGIWAGGHDKMALDPDWGYPTAVCACRSFLPAPSCPRPNCARPSGCAGRMIPPVGWHEARG